MLPRCREGTEMAWGPADDRSGAGNGPSGLNVHLVPDNYATHKDSGHPPLACAPPRFHLHFIPIGAS